MIFPDSRQDGMKERYFQSPTYYLNEIFLPLTLVSELEKSRAILSWTFKFYVIRGIYLPIKDFSTKF